MRVLGSSVLTFEAIILGLAVLVAVNVSGISWATATSTGIALIVLCFAAIAVITRPMGIVLGSLVQVAVIASGAVVPVMPLLGLIFGTLWILAVVLGRRVDAAKAAAATTAK